MAESPLSHPEARKLFSELLVALTNESPRGAVLVGTAHADNCLRNLFEATFPRSMTAAERRRVLGYPGALSSFASRIDVAYALRLISRQLYNGLSALRGIRNDCAHNPNDFDLTREEARCRQIYEALRKDVPEGLWQWALELILDYKATMVLETAREQMEEDPEYAPKITTKLDAVEFMREHKDTLAPAVQAQPATVGARHWHRDDL